MKRQWLAALAVIAVAASIPITVWLHHVWEGAHRATRDQLEVCRIHVQVCRADLETVEAVYPGLIDRCKADMEEVKDKHAIQVDTLHNRIDHCWPGDAIKKVEGLKAEVEHERDWCRHRLEKCGCIKAKDR